MGGVVYHVTDGLCLPWILASGELRPHLNVLRGIGAVDYLWATINPCGDRTSRAAILQKCMREIEGDIDEACSLGDIPEIRFTLPRAGFIPWRDIKRRSKWTQQQIDELENYDRETFGEYGQAKWRCRRKPLPLSSALKVEARYCREEEWHPIKLSRRHLIRVPNPDGYDLNVMGVEIEGFEFYSYCKYTEAKEVNGVIRFYTPPDHDELKDIRERQREAAEDGY